MCKNKAFPVRFLGLASILITLTNAMEEKWWTGASRLG